MGYLQQLNQFFSWFHKLSENDLNCAPIVNSLVYIFWILLVVSKILENLPELQTILPYKRFPDRQKRFADRRSVRNAYSSNAKADFYHILKYSGKKQIIILCFRDKCLRRYDAKY
ncbi:hypothetical protein NPIL_37751 [Nephila pilipes]|uniref:Uncharacterized protein n=1 Tax=Nephila pilipes TaxID=299642 RepID=A0A8X6T3K0_NEPPI|nr:hypothetical protein NPIL_37751 [Nephila pilipes]